MPPTLPESPRNVTFQKMKDHMHITKILYIVGMLAYNTNVLPVKTTYLRQLLQLMLSNCTLKFNNEYYSQLYGTPMGAPESVRIANT